ncbi:hypothetical protein [Cohnella sp. GbtcB17]|uniref:hypothetical protein n=1 Tax=Cohnella sp. GbtcB17 TaxID=2824762 RepID=UPI001C309631|nr:hypothetical protein [Cohnella sp. GbtcB17]
MSGPGNISSWTLTPEQRAAYAAGMTLARMDLGEPHRIDPPVLRMTSAPAPKPADAPKVKPKMIMPIGRVRKPRLNTRSREAYIELVAETNMSRAEVAEHWGVKRKSLGKYLTDWGIGQAADEAAAVEAYRRGAR